MTSAKEPYLRNRDTKNIWAHQVVAELHLSCVPVSAKEHCIFGKKEPYTSKCIYMYMYTYIHICTADAASRSVYPSETRRNTLQHAATHCNRRSVSQFVLPATHCKSLQITATHCNALQHTAKDAVSRCVHHLQHTAAHCNSLQHTATDAVSRSMYHRDLTSWLARFPRKQFLLLTTEQLLDDADTIQNTLVQIASFLNISTSDTSWDQVFVCVRVWGSFANIYRALWRIYAGLFGG